MATQWIALTRFEPKTWLLSNGEVIKEPLLEQTGSGRKIRIVGTTTSHYASELDRLLEEAAAAAAKAKNTTVFMPLTDYTSREHGALGFAPSETKAKLHLVHDPANVRGKTVAWWRFKAPNMPYEVTLTSVLTTKELGGQQVLLTRAIIPGQNRHYEYPYPIFYPIQDSSFAEMIDQMSYPWREFVRDNTPNWPVDRLGYLYPAHPRAAVTELLDVVREFEALDSIQVPDFTDVDNPAWMDLELYETNVNSEFINDLTEYLDGAPTIEQAADLYDQMLATLRSIGIVMKGKTHNDFMAALLAGEKATLNMEVLHLAEEGGRIDNDHKLSVHLPTGAFIVECNHRGVDHAQVIDSWEEAKMVASLTGEEDELLAYARAYAKNGGKRRTRAILKDRGVK